MKIFRFIANTCFGAAIATTATAAASQTVLSGDHSITGALCVGTSCTGSETFTTANEVKIKGEATSLLFQDVSTAAGMPGADWRIAINDDVSAGANYFAIEDTDNATMPFRIFSGAPAASLVVSDTGNVGLGTMLPQADLHILNPADVATLRLEGNLATPYAWDVVGAYYGLYFYNPQTYSIPFEIRSGAPHRSLIIEDSGAVGLGIETPQAALHLQRSDGTAQMLVEEVSTTISPRTLLNLKNAGRPEIVLANTDKGGEWSFGAGTKFILKQGAVDSASSAKTKLLEIDDSGNATLAGTLVTGGTTCGTGCDAVFDPDYALPSIEEHAREMRTLGYLPNVGPTPEGDPLNVSDKLGRMLNELEHAHLYIAQQQDALSAEQARSRDQAALIARLAGQVDRLTARLDTLAGSARN